MERMAGTVNVLAYWYDQTGREFGGGELDSAELAFEEAAKALAQGLKIDTGEEGVEPRYYRVTENGDPWVEVEPKGFLTWRAIQWHFAREREAEDDPQSKQAMTKLFIRAQTRELMIEEELRLRAYKKLHEEGHISTHQLSQQHRQAALTEAALNSLLVRLNIAPLLDPDIHDLADERHEHYDLFYDISKRRVTYG